MKSINACSIGTGITCGEEYKKECFDRYMEKRIIKVEAEKIIALQSLALRRKAIAKLKEVNPFSGEQVEKLVLELWGAKRGRLVDERHPRDVSRGKR